MRITLAPQRRDDALIVNKNGDALTINDETFDFSVLANGDRVNGADIPGAYFTDVVERIDGELRLTLILPHGSNPEQWQSFPEPLVNVPDGSVDIPVNTSTMVETLDDGTIRTTVRRWHQTDEVSEVKPNDHMDA